MSCSCGTAPGAKDGGGTRRPSWSQTSVDAGVTSCVRLGPLGQPGRAPASMIDEHQGGGCGCAENAPPGGWIVWLIVSIVAWNLFAKGGA